MFGRTVVRVILAAAVWLTVVAAPAHAALPSYRKIAEYDVGFGRITGVDVDGRSVYAVSSRRIHQGGRIARFKLQSGERIWRSRIVCPGWGPQVMDSVVLTQGTDCTAQLGGVGAIFAVRARDGDVAFTTEAHSGVVGDGAAYLTAFGDPASPQPGVVRAYDRKGHILWSYDPGGQQRAPVVLAAGADAVYILDDMGVVALAAGDGSVQWRHDLGPTEQLHEVYGMESDGTLFFSGQTSGGIGGAGTGSHPFTVAIDGSTGEIRWTSDGRLGDVANGIEYETADSDLVTNDYLVARSTVNGSIVWMNTAQYALGWADPIVDSGLVWVRTYDDAAMPVIHVFNAADGIGMGLAPWRKILGVFDGLVLVPKYGGRVLAFEPE